MQVIVLGSNLQRAEWEQGAEANVVWVDDVTAFADHPSADAFIDLEYINTPERNARLASLLPRPVIVNSVVDCLAESHPSFVRFNGWATFLSSPIVEASAAGEEVKQRVAKVFSLFGKRLQWLPDEPGFVTPRIVSMIINEAFLALREGVSTREEMNTAMKLGTAYPFGPFEWADLIGVQNIVNLLQRLSRTRPRYTPSELMVQETNNAI